MANEFIIRNGFISLDSSQITGSLVVSQGVTSSLLGTASWANNAISSSFATSASTSVSTSFATSASTAISSSFALSASWAPIAGTTVFPFTGAALFTGSIILTGSLTATQTVTVGSNLIVTGSIILSGSQYSFNTVTTALSAANVIISLATGSARAAFFNYVLTSGSNARAGQVASVWFINTCSFSETVTTDIGNTYGQDISARISGSFIQLIASASAGWLMETSVNLL